jgi:hypothetical protein
VDVVARLLHASPSDPGMPSETEPAGKLFLDLAPGDYMVTGACAGAYGAKLTIVGADGVPEASGFECDATLDRFLRHGGGPVTISAVPPVGKPSATGVKVQTNPDRRASELEDLSEWSAEQLQPPVPGSRAGPVRRAGGEDAPAAAEPGSGLHDEPTQCGGRPVCLPARSGRCTYTGWIVRAVRRGPCARR